MRKLVYILTISALWWPSAAAAHPRAHLAMARAQSAIVHWAGPGTVTTKCRQFSASVVGCDYETPSVNVGLVFEEEWNGYKPESGTWHGYVTVRARHGRLSFEEPS